MLHRLAGVYTTTKHLSCMRSRLGPHHLMSPRFLWYIRYRHSGLDNVSSDTGTYDRCKGSRTTYISCWSRYSLMSIRLTASHLFIFAKFLRLRFRLGAESPTFRDATIYSWRSRLYTPTSPAINHTCFLGNTCLVTPCGWMTFPTSISHAIVRGTYSTL